MRLQSISQWAQMCELSTVNILLNLMSSLGVTVEWLPVLIEAVTKQSNEKNSKHKVIVL